MVYTGVSTYADIRPIIPDGIYDDLAKLLKVWKDS
jgi:hypothetical protein